MATLLLTRPKDQSLRFASQLKECFADQFDIVVSPLIKIRTLDVTIPENLDGDLIFTSEHAVKIAASFTHLIGKTAWCVGNRTAQVASSFGFLAKSADGNARNLVDLIIESKLNGPFNYLAGSNVAMDISKELKNAKLDSTTFEVYAQNSIGFNSEAKEILRSKNTVIAPLFSTNTSREFFGATEINANLIVVAISHGVAKSVPVNLRSNMVIAKKPDKDALIDAIKLLGLHEIG